MKYLTIILVIISIFLTLLGGYFDIYKPNSIVSKELLLHYSPYLLTLAIFIELYYDNGDNKNCNANKY